MRIPGGWRAGGAGGRSIAVAVLVAGLSVATTGAASAGEPDDDERGPLIVRCEDGDLVLREPTEEDRERLRAVPAPPERPRVEERRHRVEPGEGHTRVLPDGGVIRVVPAEPGAPPPVTCEVDGPPGRPHVDRIEPAVPAPPR